MHGERLKGACALVKAGNTRGTAYLVHQEWAVTCAHVVQDQTRVSLVFEGTSMVHGQVSRERDLVGDVAFIKLEQPRSGPVLHLSTQRPAAKTECQMYGFPAIRADRRKSSPATESPLLLDGTIQLLGVDDRWLEALQIFSPNAAAVGDTPLGGLSGAPVVVGGSVVGHLRNVHRASGQAAFGVIFACPAQRVLELAASISSELRDDLALPDPDAYRDHVRRMVERLLEDQDVLAALTTQLDARRQSVDAVMDRLLELDCATMFGACVRAYETLLDRRYRHAGHVRKIALALLPLLFEQGRVYVRRLEAGSVLTICAEGELDIELLMAKRGGRVATYSRGATRGRAHVPTFDRLEEGKASPEQLVASRARHLREHLRLVLGISEREDRVDAAIARKLSWHAGTLTTPHTEQFRFYYVFDDEPEPEFAKLLQEKYPLVHVAQLERSEGDWQITEALRWMLTRDEQ